MHPLIKKFNTHFNGNIQFGVNINHEVKKIVKKNNWKNLCIVIDNNLKKIPQIKKLILSLKEYNLFFITCDISEPTYEHLEKKRINQKKRKIDVFVAIGGGSSIDFAKGLCVLYTNSERAIKYRGFNKFKKSIKPIIAIPTTAGTGSEITPNASFVNTIDKRKMGINGEAIRPKYALLDPNLTVSCPKFYTVSSAVDSLVHATEAFVAKKTNPLAKEYSKAGFKLVIENLEKVLDKPKNIKYRKKVMLGGLLSAVGLMNSGTGPAAAMSYPTGVHYKIPHGIAVAIFLPHIIKHNIKKGFYNYAKLYQKREIKKISEEKKSTNFLEEINKKWNKFSIPKNLKKLNMTKKKIKLLTNQTFELKAALRQNPVKFQRREILKLFLELSRVKLK